MTLTDHRMDCLTARHHLDCLHEEAPHTHDLLSADDRQAAEHILTCETCEQTLEAWRDFDRRFYSTLMSSSVPDGGLPQLLDRIEQELALSQLKRHSAWRRVRRRCLGIGATAAALLLLAGIWCLRPGRPVNFNRAKAVLAARFLTPAAGATWEQLEQLDAMFQLDLPDRELRRFRLTMPRGIDLGGGPSQDAAIFRFQMNDCSGWLAVLPRERFYRIPDVTTPSVQPEHSMVQWQSADGKRIYVCIVQQGSVAGLVQELFGWLT